MCEYILPEDKKMFNAAQNLDRFDLAESLVFRYFYYMDNDSLIDEYIKHLDIGKIIYDGEICQIKVS